MANLEKVRDWYGQVAYKAKPKQRVDELVLIVHSVLLHKGFVCTGAHEEEPEGLNSLTVPVGWDSMREDGLYGFRYRTSDKRYNLQLKIIQSGTPISTRRVQPRHKLCFR